MVSSLTAFAAAAGLAYLQVASALQVTQPDSSTVWTIGQPATVKFETVDTDPTVVDVYLTHQYEVPTTVTTLLASNVSTSEGSVSIDTSDLTSGDLFQIDITRPNSPEAIYAQSTQFNITAAASSSSAVASSTSSKAATTSAASATSSTSLATPSTTFTTQSSSSASNGTFTNGTSTTGGSGSTSGSTSSATGSSSSSTGTPASAGVRVSASMAGLAGALVAALYLA